MKNREGFSIFSDENNLRIAHPHNLNFEQNCFSNEELSQILDES